MHRSVAYWVEAAYRAADPETVDMEAGELALDAVPAAELRAAVQALTRRWRRNFRDLAKDLARYFARSAAGRSDAVLAAALRRGGLSVKFRTTPAVRDVLHATVSANVALIRSIPEQYLTSVEGMVMRSVQAGRDLATLSAALVRERGVTVRRAALIARDQNNKATSAIVRVRQVELGLTEAIWLHSGGGKHPRPTHVRNSGKKYDIARGWWDPAERKYVHPGELINCRCVSRPVVPGFS